MIVLHEISFEPSFAICTCAEGFENKSALVAKYVRQDQADSRKRGLFEAEARWGQVFREWDVMLDGANFTRMEMPVNSIRHW